MATGTDPETVPEPGTQPGTQPATEAATEAATEPDTRWRRMQKQAQRARADIEARRAQSASIDSALQAVERDAQTGGGVLAAAVAFRLFMFLVPYAFVMITGFGLSSTAAGQAPEDAARVAGVGGLLASAVASTSTMSLANRLFALVVGGIALAFTARSLVTVLRVVNRLIWGVTRSGHPTAWAPLILIGYVTVLFGIIDLAAWMGSQSLGLRLVAILLTIITSGGAWLLASMWLPREECRWWELLPGALIVGLGAGVLHLLTITYVAHVVSRKSSLYGAIGIAVALLLWTYFAGRLLTASIAANASLWRRRHDDPAGAPEPPETTGAGAGA